MVSLLEMHKVGIDACDYVLAFVKDSAGVCNWHCSVPYVPKKCSDT